MNNIESFEIMKRKLLTLKISDVTMTKKSIIISFYNEDDKVIIPSRN